MAHLIAKQAFCSYNKISKYSEFSNDPLNTGRLGRLLYVQFTSCVSRGEVDPGNFSHTQIMPYGGKGNLGLKWITKVTSLHAAAKFKRRFIPLLVEISKFSGCLFWNHVGTSDIL